MKDFLIDEDWISCLFSIQGDITGYMNFDDPADDTLTYNQTGLVRRMYFADALTHTDCVS